MTESSVKITNKDVILRIPISLAVHIFKHHEESEGAKIIDRKAFAERLGEMMLDIEDSESGVPNWGGMLDSIFSDMLNSGEDFIEFAE